MTGRTRQPQPRGRTAPPEEQQRYENHVRYILPLAPQLEYLQRAGFEAVDVYWKRLDNVVFGGRRPVT